MKISQRGPVLAIAFAMGLTGFAFTNVGATGKHQDGTKVIHGALEASARPGRLVRLPDGRGLNIRCVGWGKPTVILEGGFAATSLAWDKVQALAAARHKVCAYDRAGYGFSDAGPEPRDGAAVAQDLDQALKAAQLPGPYILVSHSAGALYARLFADLRPAEVAGFVFADPSVEFQDRRLAAVFGPAAGSLSAIRARAVACLDAARTRTPGSIEPTPPPCAPQVGPDAPPEVMAARLAEARRPATWRTQISELDALWTRTSEEVAAGRAVYGDTPLIVLTADGTQAATPPATRAKAEALWIQLHRELAARSCRGRQILVKGSSHLMPRDRPDVIVAAIETVASESVHRQDRCGANHGPAAAQ